MDDRDTVCFCFHVSQRKILNYLRLHRLRRASQLSECGGAGTGCGWCVPYLERYFATSVAGSESRAELALGELPAEEYERQREAYLRAGKVRGTPPVSGPAEGSTSTPQGE
ncbi:MAG: bacterioferritin-associated ferredoxin [Planctomycetaceae bacterium]|jgi:NAD(P)H-nitrite reductase large subunit